MLDSIVVRDIVEMNNCSGKKKIYITPESEDEIISCHFELSNIPMSSYEKLTLGSVRPGDVVKIWVDDHTRDHLRAGEFTQIISYVGIREAACVCTTPLHSDGFSLFCPNADCPLTLSAKINRLAGTEFFTPDFKPGSSEYFEDYFPTLVTNPEWLVAENDMLDKPFDLLTRPRFWNAPAKRSLDSILLQHKGHLDLSDFLISDKFVALIDDIVPGVRTASAEFFNIDRFFGEMREMCNRRDYNSNSQNHLISAFIWSLGIESISTAIINRMVAYEHMNGVGEDPVLSYIYLMTRPNEMVRELGIHPLEAQGIYQEVNHRRYELHDIFAAYSSFAAMKDIFSSLIERRRVRA